MNIFDIQKYKKYVENGIYENIQLEKYADRYSQQEQQSISYLDILFSSTRAETITRNGVNYKCIVDYDRSSKAPTRSGTIITREVWTKSTDYINTGDLLEYSANGDKLEQYLLIKQKETRDGYHLGIMQKCVSFLKWIDDEGVIRSAYFSFKTDPVTNFGVQDGRILTVGNERRTLILSRDEHVAKFEKAMRFIIDNRAWSISAIDTISVNGLSIVTLDETTISSNDNLELQIADYVGRVANYVLRILNEERFSIRAGRTLQLEVEVRNNNVIVSKPLSFFSSDESVATVDENGLVTTLANGTVVITAALADYPDVYDTIEGTIEFTTHDNYTVELLESPSLFINKTKTFTIQVKNNGVIDSSKFVYWTLYNEDKTSTSSDVATMINSSTTQITLKGLDVGHVWLKISIIGENLSFWVKVEVKSLI
ncbi:Ig-like domain-containing protein [Paenibacillus xylaniclasticus]|uniref:Ig-like domain-containing protein n=1 Tax=Paenibacillus xylaniclasticus TaxID=588083 RepID=UPI000FD9ACD7|nr:MULTISPECIES: Ig-like domain-containing protein [Paenibacillus]GFN32597.1 hypothetical protein PCURB6_28570 [Paenibacillus curdlanolyticus]